MPEPRVAASCDYPLTTMVWTGVLLFALKLGSRRRISRLLRNSPAFLTHLNALTRVLNPRCPHDDTLADFMRILGVQHLEDLRQRMIEELLRKRSLEYARLLGQYYMVAVDGTGFLSFTERHCKNCLTKTCSKTGITTYYHPVLEAKLVSEDWLALSLATEFIENPDWQNAGPGNEKLKQDCELKAFKRLAAKLKDRFPRLQICLLADGLYAAESVMTICEQNHWRYIIVLKEGAIPTLYREFEELLLLSPSDKVRSSTPESKQIVEWVNDIPYQSHRLTVLRCIVSTTANQKRNTFVFFTDITVTKNNCVSIANKGGRQRWKVENQGFNSQKNGGYEMEHAYGKDINTVKCFYLCLQIAHIINQLLEHSNIAAKVRKCLGSIREFTHVILMTMLYRPISQTRFLSLFDHPFQIRLNST